MTGAKALVSRQAEYDSHCPVCKQLILGYNGSENENDIMMAEIQSGEPHNVHPLDTLDQIVKVDGGWVHADCARDLGYWVIE